MIAVVILNYNSAEEAARCAASLLSTNEGLRPSDIFVVDNFSDDGYLCRDFCGREGYRFVQSAENRGYNAGNNIGLKAAFAAGYSRALIANPDMVFSCSDYLATLSAVMDDDPDCVAAGSRITGSEGDDQSPMADDVDASAWGSWRWLPDLILGRKNRRAWIDRPSVPHQAAKLCGSCLMVDLPKLHSIGWMDEGVFLYCEEAILARQARFNGWSMQYTPAVCAEHRHVSSAKGDPRPRFRAWRKSRLHFIRHYSLHGTKGRLIEASSIVAYTSLLIFLTNIRKWLTR